MSNLMEEIMIEKVVLNIGGVGDKLDRGAILLEKLTGRKPVKVKATRRIPAWQVRPGLEVGVKVTLRGQKAIDVLKKLLPAVDNTLKDKQVQDNFFSFGIHEYIEIPGVDYIREVGILGFEVTATFSRKGKNVKKKKVKGGKVRKMIISRDKIKEFLKNKFGTEIIGKGG